MKTLKNKKSLVALLLVAILGIVGVTIAYFTSTDTFTNIFRTKPYQIQTIDIFESPSDWTPGNTTDKVVFVNNTGNVTAAVRISYTEEWKDANDEVLPLLDGNDNPAAVINFAGDWADNWIKNTEGGVDYYYYKTSLKAGYTTPALMESVTFNPDVEITTTKNCETEDTATICTTSAGGYAGGTYTLTIKVETVQFDQYQEAWGTNVSITNSTGEGD